MGKFSRVIWGKVLRFNGALPQRFSVLTGPLGPKAAVAAYGHAYGVHSEHDLKEQSDAQIIVSRFPFRGKV